MPIDKISTIIDGCYNFIIDFQNKYNKNKKVEPDAQQMLQCNLAILTALTDAHIKRTESEHLMNLKDKQFELEKQIKLLSK